MASKSMIDCFINGYGIQCKTSSVTRNLLYHFTLRTHGERKNGKRTRIAYPFDNPIDFFIFEITAQPNQFYIVPKDVLKEKGFFRSKDDKGNMGLYIPPLDYEGKSKYRWLLEYVNRTDLLAKEPMVAIRPLVPLRKVSTDLIKQMQNP
jgi:hypothetical protein